VGGPESLGHVLARRGRTVDRAADGDVVAGAVTAVAAVVAHPGALLGGGLVRRAVAAEGVVALEGVGREVVDVDVLSRSDLLAGETDDLAVLVDGRALLDGDEGDLVAEADAGGEGDGLPLEGEGGAGREVTGGDGDVVVGGEADGEGGELGGGHGVHRLRRWRSGGEQHGSRPGGAGR